MTNHPNRSSYRQLIARLQRLSCSAKVAPDARRLAVDAYQMMIAADRNPRDLKSDASYRNLYGAAWTERMKEDKEAIEADRQDAMERARHNAEQFILAWSF